MNVTTNLVSRENQGSIYEKNMSKNGFLQILKALNSFTCFQININQLYVQLLMKM